MLQRVSASENDASFAADKAVGKSVPATRKSVSDENWFSDMCRETMAKPGLEIHLLTGIDERSCHRYASGEVKPPAHLLRTLLRGDRGEAFLAFVMHDSESTWWHQIQRDRRLAASARSFIRETDSM